MFYDIDKKVSGRQSKACQNFEYQDADFAAFNTDAGTTFQVQQQQQQNISYSYYSQVRGRWYRPFEIYLIYFYLILILKKFSHCKWQ